jgi:hypothetical protein
MTYQFTETGSIRKELENGSLLFLPAESNGTSAWAEYQAWLDEGNTPEPYVAPPLGPDYLAFWDALMGSTVYGSIREQSFVSLPMNTLATEFIALIGDAKAGRANEAAIQASISAILSVGTFSEEQLLELGAAFVAGNLDSIYSIA